MSFIEDRESIYFRCVEDCNESIMITDLKGRLVYVNPAWCRTYGYSSNEALGETPRILRSNHQDDDFYRLMWSQILDPQVGHWRGELVNRAKNGGEVPSLLTITPYKNSSGQILGFMGVALDLTEQHKLKKHIVHQERLATIGELTSGLAHEIGTPIGVIRGRAEMMLMEPSLPPSASKAVDIIIRQADRITSLISTLLRFSRTNSQTSDLHPVMVGRVAQEVVNLVAEKARQHHIQLETEIPAEFQVWGDSGKLEQILVNLALNAIYALSKFQPRGPAHGVRIRARAHGSWALIEVEDTGPGISQDLREKIFLPFFTTKPTGEGTGLGLSIVLRLAHDMNGQLNLDSSYQEGARFILRLKLYEGLSSSLS